MDALTEKDKNQGFAQKIDNIRKAILCTGFQTEIRVSQLLQNEGWFVINQAPYFDSKENDYRFIDVFALKKGGCLAIECKKTLKGHPWVFFTQSKNDQWPMTATWLSQLGGPLNKEGVRYPSNSHWLNPSVRVGTVFSGPFDKKNGKQNRSEFLVAMKQIQSIMVHFFAAQSMTTYPVVVFDGDIYEFSNQEIDLKPINHLQYIHAQLKDGVIWPFLVDVVTLGHFPEFIKTVNSGI